jgi:LysR family nitrogen assimilation transcriptional regulator
MDLKQLEYFLRVKECGSFSAAAALLRIAQPSLSRQIRLLELELQHKLFVRHGRGVDVTEAGRVLAEQAQQILRQVDLTRQSLNRMHTGVSGRLAVGMPSSLIRVVGVPLFMEFRNSLPDVCLSITDGFSISLHEWLLTGRLDIALLYKPFPSSDINSIPVLDEELLLFAPSSRQQSTNPIMLQEIARLPLILPRRPHEIRALTEKYMDSLGCKPNVALEVDSIPAILQFLVQGDLFGILPKYAVSVYSNSSTFVGRRIVSPSLCSKLVLATSARKTTTPLIEMAIRLIFDVCDNVLDPIKQASAT